MSKPPAFSAYLEEIGIDASCAATFAAALAKDGYNTPVAFAELTLEELKADYGFKKGHIRVRYGSSCHTGPRSAI